MSEITASMRRIGSPFWRMYLFSVMQLVLAGVCAYLVLRAVEGPLPLEQIRAVSAAALSSQFDDGVPDRAGLSQVLGPLHELMHRDLAIYDAQGLLLASAGDRIPPPIPAGKAASLIAIENFEIAGRTYVAAPVDEKAGAYVIAQGEHMGGPPVMNIVLGLATMLLVLALLTVPLAYGITLPIQKIINTARRLADGDLTARTGIPHHGEIGRLGLTVDHMADRLQARIQGEKELVANISHEIRTPLARIRVAQEMCSEEGATLEEMKESLDGIGEDVLELQKLIDDVLKVSRLDLAEAGSGRADIALRLEPMDIRDVTGRSARRFSSMHPGHRLLIDVPDGLPDIEADPSLVRRVVDNLLDNAAKYSGTTEPIEIAVTADSERILVTVCDRGIGVEEADLEKIFEPFFRAETEKTRYTAGTGLGLALCKRIADAHGGSISAARRDAGGLVISFAIPLSHP